MRRNFLDDEDIIRRIGMGDEEAERALVERYFKRLLSAARANGLSEQDAEEAVSDALLKAIEKARNGQLGSNVGPWLDRVTRNRAVDIYRREAAFRGNEAAALRRMGPSVAEDSGTNVFNFRRLRVRRAMKHLSERDRRVLANIAENCSDAEIAEYEHVTENNARQIRHRALKRLERELSKLKR